MRNIVLFFILMGIVSSCGPSKTDYYKLLSENEKLEKRNIELNDSVRLLMQELNLCNGTTPNENIQKIGCWYDSREPAECTILLNKNLSNGYFYMIHKWKSGGNLNEKVRVSKVNGLTKIEPIESDHVEWYIIEKNGDLSMWSQNGKYATALCF